MQLATNLTNAEKISKLNSAGDTTLYGVNRNNSGVISIDTYEAVLQFRWTDCLGYLSMSGVAGGTTAQNQNNPIAVFFPASFTSTDKVTKWLSFIATHYGVDTVNHGIVNLPANHYYGVSTGVLPSYVIEIPVETKIYQSVSQYLLYKVSLVRYIYITRFHDMIIPKIYELVDGGMDAWDALIIAHLNAIMFCRQDPNSGQGTTFVSKYSLLADSIETLPLIWPKSKEDVVAMMGTKTVAGTYNNIHGTFQISPAAYYCHHTMNSNEYYSNTYLKTNLGFGTDAKIRYIRSLYYDWDTLKPLLINDPHKALEVIISYRNMYKDAMMHIFDHGKIHSELMKYYFNKYK